MVEGEIVKLRELRGIPKALVTKLEKWVLTKGHEATLYELESKLEQLIKYESQFDKVQLELEMKDPEERAEDAEERATFEDRVANVKAKLREYKAAFHNETLNETHGGGTINVDVVDSDLPKIEIPKFAGEYCEYPQFMDTFNTIVHASKAKGMTDIRRFALLKGSLTGKALDTIKCLPMTSENYSDALNLLDERFNRKRLIFEAFVKRLWELPRAVNTETLRQLCDSYIATEKGLKLIATPEEIVSGVIIQLLLTKCDKDTIRRWEEQSADKDDLPSEDEFTSFLRRRCVQLESVDYAFKHNSSASKPEEKPFKTRQKYTNSSVVQKLQCPICDQKHTLSSCPSIVSMTPEQRYSTVKKAGHCVRCINLPKSHGSCQEICKLCKKLHHELLHFEQPNGIPESQSKPSSSTCLGATLGKFQKDQVVTDSKLSPINDPSCSTYTLLATANVQVKTDVGNYVTLRVLLDGGSQLNLISDRARNILGLKAHRMRHAIELNGINNKSSVLHSAIVVQMKSFISDFEETLVLVVHPRLRQRHPLQSFSVQNWNIPDDIKLADPYFNVPHDIDIILNATPSYKFLLPSQIALGIGMPLLQETQFGFIVVGDMSLGMTSKIPSHTCTLTDSISVPHTTNNLADYIKKFWELEEVKISEKLYSKLERQCEEHFKASYQRDPHGRFIVRLPFQKPASLLGNSRDSAIRRLYAIEKKMNTSSNYCAQYTAFIQEYIDLGHCTEVNPPDAKTPHYYIPHFAVTNENSTTTKTRVVFDASSPSDSGYSLNDLLMVGPKIQDDLVVHLLRFRCNLIAFTGDICKMYRQMLVSPDDRNLQLIVFRFPNETKIRTYQLNTVTYGTASAPYAAVRCLQELANCESNEFPLAHEVLTKHFYVDDMLSGGNSPRIVKEMYQEVKEVLSRGGMSIHKFHSNSDEVLSFIPEQERGKSVDIGGTEVAKTLGLNWIPQSDRLVYYYKPSEETKITKRTVLSETSRLFDPLGLLQPVVIKAKIFMQQLWANKLGWDDQLPTMEYDLWLKFREELENVHMIDVPRYVLGTNHSKNIELHGYCDASERAYGACIYLKTVSKSETHVNLLISKTRVSPLKTVSLPRLELCGALLLAELYNSVRSTLDLKISRCFLWTDSMIGLHWITNSPHKWNSFVATRVTKIQDLTKGCEWRHVPTESNPADIASRGLFVSELQQNLCWFYGPDYLLQTEDKWPQIKVSSDIEVPEEKHRTVLLTTVETDLMSQCKYMKYAPILQFTVWPKMRRVFSYVHRFVHRCRTHWRTSHNIQVTSNLIEPLNVQELNHGTLLMVKIVQKQDFQEEFNALLTKSPVPKRSKCLNLSPFCDDQGILRVGGRLENAAGLDFNQKFPIIIAKGNPLVKLLFIWAHNYLLHAGPSAMLAFIRRTYWPVQGKTLANQVVNSCLRCRRLKPVTFNQILGPLPADRVSTVSRPFTVTGVDFAGPFKIHYRLRGSRTTEAYVAVFVCFNVKAVHLELVEDLSTASFLNALRRFVSRRGAPVKIWSDNATNFVGANNKLKEFSSFFLAAQNQEAIANFCRDDHQIQWSFIPPRCPHWGGLWEAAVKSAKFHICRVVGLATLTFPELETVLTMVESVLNNRPIIPLSMNPADSEPLTPAHFLLGTVIKPIPESEVPDLEANPVQLFEKTVAIKQSFWKKWSSEYLHTLQKRYKWSNIQENVKIGEVVLVVDTCPSMKWSFGKIVETYPDKNGHVRSVRVQTKSGIYKRGITELCPLAASNSTSD